MTDKQQELELKQTLESLEEYFTLISFNSNYERLTILSVESAEQAALTDTRAKANVIQLDEKRQHRQQPVIISKALHFQDNYYRS